MEKSRRQFLGLPDVNGKTMRSAEAIQLGGETVLPFRRECCFHGSIPPICEPVVILASRRTLRNINHSTLADNYGPIAW